MILARNSITLHHLRDITTVVWYYKLQASTASPPAKPTTATPSGWSTTEPSYTEGSTNSLYVVQKTTFSDGTFEYSDVSLSTSYEAAKAAYNKSVQAQTTANAAQESIDNLEIGGRNLIYNSATMPAVANGDKGWRASGGTVTHVDLTNPPIYDITGAIRVTNTGSSTTNIGIAQDKIKNKFIVGEKYTQSCWVRASETLRVYLSPIWASSGQATGGSHSVMGYFSIGTEWTYIKWEGAVLKGEQATSYSAGYVYAYQAPANSWFEVCGMKLEKGAKATDWTPAPEDVEADINEAKKTANNYLSADNTGIMVADMTDGNTYTPGTVPSGTKNTFIDEDSFQVRDGQETLASFGETSQIGKDGAAHMEMDDESISFVSQNGTDTATMGAMSSTVKSVSESYTTDSDSLTITLSSDVTQGGTITLTVNNSAYTITYGTPYSYTGSTYSISYTGGLNILITNTGGITLNATVAYTTTIPTSYGIAVTSEDDASRICVASRHNDADVANGALLTTTSGSFGLFDYKNSKWLIRTDSEGNVYLPIKAIKPKTIFNHKVVSFMNDAWNYVSVSQLADYNVVLVRAECYEVRQLLVFCRLFGDNPMYLMDFAGSTRVRGGFIVDWTNNRVGVRYMGGGAYSANIYFQQVYGIL